MGWVGGGGGGGSWVKKWLSMFEHKVLMILLYLVSNTLVFFYLIRKSSFGPGWKNFSITSLLFWVLFKATPFRHKKIDNDFMCSYFIFTFCHICQKF